MSAPMFWAGALMAFTPIVSAIVVTGIWWHVRKKKIAAEPSGSNG